MAAYNRSDYIQITNPELGFNGSTLHAPSGLLNRILTGHGKCATLHRWTRQPSCDWITETNDPPYRFRLPIPCLWRKPPGLRGVLSRRNRMAVQFGH
ncbi:hypothetical protein JTB14_025148 [Gonioctena quinquepunctata]|nr:hypothetical protein JTB14_025148 [Gonioctena quinquepunctata]